MKKLVAVFLTVVMVLGCSVGLAAPSAQMLAGDWTHTNFLDYPFYTNVTRQFTFTEDGMFYYFVYSGTELNGSMWGKYIISDNKILLTEK